MSRYTAIRREWKNDDLHFFHDLAGKILDQPVSLFEWGDEIQGVESLFFETVQLLDDFFRMPRNTEIPDHFRRHEAGFFRVEIAVMAGMQRLMFGFFVAAVVKIQILFPDGQDKRRRLRYLLCAVFLFVRIEAT